jgi:hypothetical protein
LIACTSSSAVSVQCCKIDPQLNLKSDANFLLSFLRAAVVVLSPEFVQKKHPMRELQIFLERKAADPSSLIIIPVFIGLTVEQCDNLEALYLSQPWPKGVPKLIKQETAETLKEWAAAVKQLLLITVAKSEEVGIALLRSALIVRRIFRPQCSGIKYYISSYAPIHATEGFA